MQLPNLVVVPQVLERCGRGGCKLQLGAGTVIASAPVLVSASRGCC